MNVNSCLQILGKKVREKITGFEGVATSVAFDLYGCIQVVVHPEAKENKPQDGHFFDFQRLEVIDPLPVMQVPSFVPKPEARISTTGPAEKPAAMLK